MDTNILQLMAKFRNAVTDAQARTGDRTISTAVQGGKVQVCRVTYDKNGNGIVSPLTPYLTFPDALDFLNQMGA